MSSDLTKPTALAILTATYTDSEGELNSDDDATSPSEDVKSLQSTESPSSSHESTKQVPKIVSYAEDGWNDDSDDSDFEYRKYSEDSEQSDEKPPDVWDYSPISFHKSLLSLKPSEVQLPPEPRGKCSDVLLEKISELYDKKVKEGKDMNATIQNKKNFRNPSIYEKLINYCAINELETNYPPEIYNPHCWGPESFYDELAKRQKEEMDKRAKERNTKVQSILGKLNKPSEVDISGVNEKAKAKDFAMKRKLCIEIPEKTTKS